MIKRKFFKRLAVQTSLYFLIATIIAVIIAALLLYSAISSIVMEQSLSHTKTSVENSGKYVDAYLSKLDGISHSLASNPQVKRYIDCCDEDEEILRQDVLSLIDSSLMTDVYLRSITLITKDGRIISNEKELDMSISPDMTEEEWYMDAVACSGIPILTGARMTEFSLDKNTWVISMAREISDENGTHLGVALIDFDYKGIEDYIIKSDLGADGYAFILDSEGNLVFHNDIAYFGDESKLQELKDFAALDEGYDEKTKMLLHSYSLNDENWALYGVASLDELDAIKVRMVNIFVIIGVMLFAIVIGIGIIMSRKVTNPITKLEKKMSEFNQDFEKIEIDESACFEAQSLSYQFNEMIKTIKVLVKEVKYNERALKLYELNVLRSQINPHFLYNTLDTIIWMAEFGDDKKVVDITKALASFFRLSLSKGDELTTVKDEMDHVSQYLYIQSQRYEKMSYSVDVEESIKDIKVPKIILQPIVENAIYHGIKPKQAGGGIDIKCYRDKDYIVFEIKDNGVGFDIKKKGKGSGMKLGGVGINNVDERIKLEYGNDSGVFIESEIGKGTTVKIKIETL